MSTPTGGPAAHSKAADRFPPSVYSDVPLSHEQHLDGDGKSSDYPKPVSDASRSGAGDDGNAGIGVSRVEAFNKVLYQSGKSGKIILWLLGISIGLTMFAYALDQGITGTIFTTMASSTFGQHSSLAARRGEKMGMVTMAASKRLRTGAAGDSESTGLSYWIKLLGEGLIDIDIFGLIILGTSFSLILLPFTLAESADGGWGSPRIIAMLVVGFVLLIGFVLFEMYVSPKPFMTKHILQNRTFLAAAAIYTFNQMASAVRNTYFSSYVYIIKQWSTYEWTIFLGITTMGLSIMGPIVGLIQRSTHRYKSMMVFGAVARLIAYGLLVQPNGNMVQDTARLVIAQLLYCLGSFNVVGARVGSQASVPHEDMATIIAVLTLWSTLGSSVGSAVSSAIWTSEMLDRMRKEMPDVDEKTLAKLYGNIKKLRTTYDFNDPVRQGAIRAYAHVNGHIAITALLLAAVPLFATFFMPDFYLGKQQNAVTNTGLDGEAVDLPQRELRNDEASGTAQEQSRSFYYKWLAFYRKDA
ncbi:Siderophore iron transporter 3 [Colletotrichum sp. SAR 10_65]|nr:Siderophore iron transporter 3 [Colletotrichum sp. SAR 10_65]